MILLPVLPTAVVELHLQNLSEMPIRHADMSCDLLKLWPMIIEVVPPVRFFNASCITYETTCCSSDQSP